MAKLPSEQSFPIKVYPGRNRPEVLTSGCVLTIGAFDGIHLGHQKVIGQLREHAERLQLPSAVMTFRPDPAEFFGSTSTATLMNWREKMLGLKATGVDEVLCMPFDKRVSSLTAEEFVEELVAQLGIRFLMVGDDFRFGAGRKGDYEMLVNLGQELGFDVARSDTHSVNGSRISSTRVRECLAIGNLAEARELLGRDYQICGKVVTGHKLGRDLGFPTANIPLKRRSCAMKGVFAVIAELESGEQIPAVANLGVRPAVNSLEKPLLEVHLLDYDGDLYGQRMQVSFKAKIREEAKFDGLEALKEAIQADVEQARDWFLQNPVV